MDHATGAVLAQRQVDGAPEEVTGFRPLLADLDLTDVVVTADALHTKRDAARFLVTNKHAHYLFTVKGNQPSLHAQLRALPWRQIPVLDRTRDRGHGRVETRTLKVATVPGLGFPHATQALRITRRVRDLHRRRWRTVTVYAITSLSAIQASPARLADLVRGHGAIENGLHHVRDVTHTEDASRPGPGPRPAPRRPRATSPSARSAWPGSPTSPPGSDVPAATLPDRCNCSASNTHEPDITTLRRNPAEAGDRPGRPHTAPACRTSAPRPRTPNTTDRTPDTRPADTGCRPPK
jgi:predicted transposase YbfD/YdcC